MPKSSSAMRTPSFAQLMQRLECRLVVADQHGLGDFEFQPRGGEAATPQSAAATLSASVWLSNCTGETLTATRTSSGQFAASAHAVCSTQSPSSLIRPVLPQPE